MNIYLSEKQGDQLRGDLIVSSVYRSDLAPVPRTIELVLRDLDGLESRIADGGVLWGGRELLKYRIVKVKRVPTGLVANGQPLNGVKVTCLLDSCADLSTPRARAVVRENASLAGVLRACGATAAVENDFHVHRFSALCGEVPSFAVAQALQEEGAVLRMQSGRLSVARLDDLFKQAPVREIVGDPGDATDSEYMERHQVPSFISVDATGAIMRGNFDVPRGVVFMPRTGASQLHSMTRVLVTRRVLTTELAAYIEAGDLMVVNGEKLVVITAAHAFQQADAAYNTVTKLWLGSLSA